MNEISRNDQVFSIIMNRFLESGQAPHYTEIAAELKVSPEEGRQALHELFSMPMFPGWLYPNTDYIVSFPPFNNLPTQYRISVDGEQKWFAQWGFEALAVSRLYPGKTVEITAPCLDCGSPIMVKMTDGEVLTRDPEGIVGYTCMPFREWGKDLPHAWSTMNLFRSEAHVREWRKFEPGTEEGIVPLSDLAQLFSGDLFAKRLDSDYASHMQEYMMGFAKALQGKGSFWQL